MHLDENTLFVGDVNTALIVKFTRDLTLAVSPSFVLESPRKVRSEIPAAVHSINGEAIYLRAVLDGTEFSEPGLWTVWPKMTMGDSTGRCKPVYDQEEA